MAMSVLILGASYGSLLSTKFLMAGHSTTLVCRPETAALINARGTLVRITRAGESRPDEIHSGSLKGNVAALPPGDARPADFDLVVLAMQEPQLRSPLVRDLLDRVAESGRPCLSIMNMPPLAYLRRIPHIDASAIRDCYTAPDVWDRFDPENMTLCSPDAQAFRPPGEPLNVLQVGLPTNFKAARYSNPGHNAILDQLESDILAARHNGHEVPVKLRAHDSLFIPMAKWSMLVTGNYRCITSAGPRTIMDAVHHDHGAAREIYGWVDSVVQRLGAKPEDRVPFEKYAIAAKRLLKPSSAARAVAAGACHIERVDKLVQKIGRSFGMRNESVDESIRTVDAQLAMNRNSGTARSLAA